MAVIPASHMLLMRKRRHLHELMKAHRWDEISAVEVELFNEINAAVDDPQRSPQDLLAELGCIISVYKELSDLCHMYQKQIM